MDPLLCLFHLEFQESDLIDLWIPCFECKTLRTTTSSIDSLALDQPLLARSGDKGIFKKEHICLRNPANEMLVYVDLSITVGRFSFDDFDFASGTSAGYHKTGYLGDTLCFPRLEANGIKSEHNQEGYIPRANSRG